MRNLDDVTEEELRAAYDTTPAFNQYVPWPEVLANSIYSTILKNQVISQEEKAMEKEADKNRIFLAVDNGTEKPVFTGNFTFPNDLVITTAPVDKKPIRRSTITLHERQIEKIKTALTLSRNCLKYGGMSDVVRNEALESLAESQKIIQAFYEPRA